MSNEVDVAVIGGGVAGLACGAGARRTGASVCVIERESRPGRGTSTHNSGVIHAGIYYPPGSLKARLCVEGRDRLYEFCAAARRAASRDAGSCSSPRTTVKSPSSKRCTPQGARPTASRARDGRRRFRQRRKEPHVRAVAALWSPDTGIVEAEALVKALEQLCREHDVAMVVGSPLVGADAHDRRHRARHAARAIRRRHRRQCGRAVCRRRLGAARRQTLSHQSVPRRIRGARRRRRRHG